MARRNTGTAGTHQTCRVKEAKIAYLICISHEKQVVISHLLKKIDIDIMHPYLNLLYT